MFGYVTGKARGNSNFVIRWYSKYLRECLKPKYWLLINQREQWAWRGKQLKWNYSSRKWIKNGRIGIINQ